MTRTLYPHTKYTTTNRHSTDCTCGSQVIIGFVRPSPTSNIRPFWNAVHHNLGRLTIVSAWATLYMGIYMAHESLTYQASCALPCPRLKLPTPKAVHYHLRCSHLRLYTAASCFAHTSHYPHTHFDGPLIRPTTRRGSSPWWW